LKFANKSAVTSIKLLFIAIFFLFAADRIVVVSYDSNVDHAKNIVRELAEKHPLSIDNRKPKQKKDGRPIVGVAISEFGDSSVVLRAFIWVKNEMDGILLTYDLNETVKQQFDKKGIEIPFPYRTLVFKDQSTPKVKAAGN